MLHLSIIACIFTQQQQQKYKQANACMLTLLQNWFDSSTNQPITTIVHNLSDVDYKHAYVYVFRTYLCMCAACSKPLP